MIDTGNGVTLNPSGFLNPIGAPTVVTWRPPKWRCISKEYTEEFNSAINEALLDGYYFHKFPEYINGIWVATMQKERQEGDD